jgi:hypothetical protein
MIYLPLIYSEWAMLVSPGLRHRALSAPTESSIAYIGHHGFDLRIHPRISILVSW